LLTAGLLTGITDAKHVFAAVFGQGEGEKAFLQKSVAGGMDLQKVKGAWTLL